MCTVATLLTGVRGYLSPGDLFLWLWRRGVKLWTSLWVALIGAGDGLHFYKSNVEPEPVIGTVLCVFFLLFLLLSVFDLCSLSLTWLDDLRKQF